MQKRMKPSKFQLEALEIMSKGNNIIEVKTLLPKVKDIYYKYVQLLKENKVLFDDLAFAKRLSKDSNKYQKRNTIERNALIKLKLERFYIMS
jgi:DNA polymerase elongation subunit (family B)